MTYTVIYSPNGIDRYVVASGVTTTSLDLDFSDLPAGNRAYIIVRATDGFNSAEDASDGPFITQSWQLFLPLIWKGATG